MTEFRFRVGDVVTFAVPDVSGRMSGRGTVIDAGAFAGEPVYVVADSVTTQVDNLRESTLTGG